MHKIIQLTALMLLLSIAAHSQADITAEEYQTHLKFLASDSLKGRYPGTPESELAADYIRTEFNKAGLELIEDSGFQYFEIITGIEAGENNSLRFADEQFRLGKDFLPLSISSDTKLTAGLSFAGYGLPEDSVSGQDNSYAGIDVSGQWVMILKGSPEGKKRIMPGDPAGLQAKIRLAERHNAAGVLIAADSRQAPEDELLPLSYRRGSRRGDIPVIQIKRALADKILQSAGKSPADVLAETIRKENQSGSFDTRLSISAQTDLNYIKKQARNVVGLLPGSDPDLADEYVIIGAHYDHLGFGQHGSRDPHPGAIHYGADDNASGTASVIETAEYFALQKKGPKRSLVFVAFDAEEMGLLGSAFFADSADIDMKKVYAMVNFDMLGRLSEEKPELTISGTGTAEEFETILDKFEKKTKIAQAYNPSGQGASDHSSFYRKDIPVLFFSTGGHQDYHTSRDTYDKINFEGMRDVSVYVADIVEYLANREESLQFKESKNKRPQRMTLKVTLGVMPGFGATDVIGLRIDGVSADGPAEAAGLERGDVIKKIGEFKIKDIYEYMEVLQKFERGQETSLEYEREGKLKKTKVKF